MIRLVVLDLDNTTLTNDKSLSEATLKQVRKLSDQGVLFTLATGRAFELTRPYADALGITLPLIVNNGALIKTPEGRITMKSTLERSAKRDLLRHARAYDLGYTYYTENGFYSNDTERLDVYERWNETHLDSRIVIHKRDNTDELIDIDAYKLLILDQNEERFIKNYRKHEQRDDATVTRSQSYFLDVLPPNTSKATALARLIEDLGLMPEQVLAFGDNDNDAEMLKYAGIGVAMPHGSDRAKAAADTIALADNDADGVARTLKVFADAGQFDK